MANTNSNANDKCKHGEKHADCVECNPIFKSEGGK
jgi:hypothetical protein